MIEPEAVRQKFPDISEERYNELMALYTTENTNAPFEDFYIFSVTVLALNGIVPDITKFEVPSVPQIWYAVRRMRRTRPKMEFSHEVKEFIKRASNEEGYYIYPPGLDMNTELYLRAKERLEAGDLSEKDTYSIQAAKLAVAQHYINRMERNAA